MGRTADLVRSLEALSMCQNQRASPKPSEQNSRQAQHGYSRRQPHHELFFDYPALHLLSYTGAALLPEPHLIDFRPRPDAQKHHLSYYPQETFLILNPKAEQVDLSTLDSKDQAAQVFSVIDALSGASGRTTISLISHCSSVNLEVRLQIVTEKDDGKTTRTWDLSVEDWARLLRFKSPWLSVMADAFYRKTAKTYLAAEQKLKSQDESLWRKDIDVWQDRWQSRVPRSALTLFGKRLRVAQTDEVLTLKHFQKQHSVEIQLPCGHYIGVSGDDFLALTDECCRSITCSTCGDLILQPRDLLEAEAFHKYIELLDATDIQAGWEGLDRDPLNTFPQMFDSDTIATSLFLALESLRAPKWIQSTYLSLLKTEETEFAVKTLAVSMSEEATVLTNPAELANTLNAIVMDALKSTSLPKDPLIVPTPPGWTTFLRLWLNRAVNFMVHRQCALMGEEHVGMHWHKDDGLVYWGEPWYIPSGMSSEECSDVEMKD